MPIKNPDLLAKKIDLLLSDIDDKEKYENLKGYAKKEKILSKKRYDSKV